METVEEFLEHHGVKGMKWGVRKKRSTAPVKVSTTATPGKRVKATGGQNQRASADAVRAAKLKQRAKASTTDTLSNKELKAAIERMQLERQFSQLQPPSGGKAFMNNLLQKQGQVALEQLVSAKRDELLKELQKKL